MSKSSLNQFVQIRGSRAFDDTLITTLAGLTGRSKVSGLTVDVTNNNTVTITAGGAFEERDNGNFIVIADSVYEIIAYTSTSVVTVGGSPANGTDISAAIHYFQNLEDDLNYVRTQLKDIIGEDSWTSQPDITLSGVQNELDNLSAEYLNLTDTYIGDQASAGTFIADNMLYTSSSGVHDTSNMTYSPSSGDIRMGADGDARLIIDAANSQATLYAADNSYITVSGTGSDFVDDGTVRMSLSNEGLKLQSGVRVNDIVSIIAEPGDDTSIVTEKAIVDYVSTLSGSSQSVWEVVDTPTDRVQLVTEHSGLPIYTPGDMTIGGDLTVTGTTFFTNTEHVQVSDNIITVNYGEVGVGVTAETAGIQIDRGSMVDYFFIFDETQDNFRVGVSGSTQAVATREDNPTDSRVPYWNAAEKRFTTSGTSFITIDPGWDELKITSMGYTGYWQYDADIFVGDAESGNTGFYSSAYPEDPDDWHITGLKAAGVEGLQISNTTQRIGVYNKTVFRIDQPTEKFEFDIDGITEIMTIDPTGMTLESGTNVNKILDSNDNLDNLSTDDQLATAKLIYDELQAVAGHEDSPIDTRVPHWDDTDKIFTTSGTSFISIDKTWEEVIIKSNGYDGYYQIDDYIAVGDDTNLNGLLYIDSFGTGGVAAACGGEEVLNLAENYQILGNRHGIQIRVNQPWDTIWFQVYNSDPEVMDLYNIMTFDATGMTLESGTNVNKILDSNDNLDNLSTDDQLATAKLIYNELQAVSSGSNEFIEMTDSPATYSGTAGQFVRVSDGTTGVIFESTVSSDGSTLNITSDVDITGTLGFDSGTAVDEIVTTVTSGSTDAQLPTAGAVWDLAGEGGQTHTHYDKDMVLTISGIPWTLTDASIDDAVPDMLSVYVNGLKNRDHTDYYTATASGTILSVSFAYSTDDSDWVNVTYLASDA